MMKACHVKSNCCDHYAFDFFSVHDMRDYIAAMPLGRHYAERSHTTSRERTKFTGSTSYEAAEKLLDYGCPDIAAKLAKTVCKTQKIELKNSFVQQQAGFVPVVASWLCGDPRSMLAVKRQRRQARVIDVYISCSYSCYVSAEAIIRGQSRALSMVRGLEESGLRVNIWAFFAVAGSGREFAYYLRLKKAEEKLNILKLSYPLCHPSFLRRHFFALLEHTAAADTKDLSCNYGRPLRDEALLELVGKTKKIGENAIVFPAEVNDCKFYAFLKKQNCEFAEKALINF